MSGILSGYQEIWLVDCEFSQPAGENPEVICCVAREYHTGRTLRIWSDEIVAMVAPPFRIDSSALFVAYYASAELGCFLQLNWPMPTRILDLYAEFRCLTNGLQTPCGDGLLGTLSYHGLDSIEAAEKKEMRDLAIRGGPFSDVEREDLLNYCEIDVISLGRILKEMALSLDMPRALLRGRYMTAVARMEHYGTPIDVDSLVQFQEHWSAIKGQLTQEIDADYGVYIPTGQRPLNPNSDFGEAVLAKAEDWVLEPDQLAASARDVLQENKERTREFRSAVKAARQATGLTSRKIERWENQGGDYSTWPRLDVQARELASIYPELGIGSGYVYRENYDDTDYADLLWELLREDRELPPRAQDPAILSEAADRISSESGELWYDYRSVSFSTARFTDWLIANNIPWPRLATGALDLRDDTFRQMARSYPQVAPLRELRHTLGEMRLFTDLTVGEDDRNRCLLSPFRSITGRNQPSNAKFIFGPSCWLRALIKPEPGMAIAYVDWSQQEFGIAAALSGDTAMQAAYLSGDPYLTFAKQAGAVPSDATKQSHAKERDQFKICALAVQYGMGSRSLASSIGQPEPMARELLRLHRKTYPKFWEWSESAVNHAMALGWLQTVFGWRVQVGPRANSRSLANFPMQANGAEMLRLACCLTTEAGIRVCCPIHDAILVEGRSDDITTEASQVQHYMAEASRLVLDGFELNSDVKIVRYPDRYMDPRGGRMWATVTAMLERLTERELLLSAEDF